MKQIQRLQDTLRSLRFGETANHLTTLLETAATDHLTYAQFLMKVMEYEQKRREEKRIERHLKWATFPYHKTLNQFNLNEQQSLSQKQFNKLAELIWIEQLYNLRSEEHTSELQS